MSGAKSVRVTLRHALAFVLTLLVAASLTGCSWVDERAVRAGVAQALDRYEQPSAAEAAALFEDVGLDVSDLAAAGIDVESFAQRAFAHFGYDILDATVDGGVADVRLQVSNVDCRAIAAELADEMAGHAADFDEMLLRADGERELVETYFTELGDRLDAAAPQTSEVTVRLMKEQGAWHLEGASEDALADALFGEARP